MNEPSALLTLKTDWMENAALGPVGPDGNLSGRDEAGDRSDPATSRSKTDRPAWTDGGGGGGGETSPMTRWSVMCC